MSYVSIHNSRERMELAAMGVLFGMFLLVMSLMFVHPTAALAVFWLGLIAVLTAGGINKLLGHAERRAARKSLARHACPRCGAPIQWDGRGEAHWHCEACRADFLADGMEEGGRRDRPAASSPSRPALDGQPQRRSLVRSSRPAIHRR